VTSGKKKRVLFVCVGNCCRSQMAEGFAAYYGGDVLVAESAGLAPAGVVVDETVRSMAEKGIDISGQYSKALRVDQTGEYDLIVNMSGFSLPDGVRAPAVAWLVPDPIGQSGQVYAQVCDQIEALVLQLISYFRQERSQA
jgi:arsenate reductase (thioredoxin)